VLGDPVLSRSVRTVLTADGRPTGGPSPTVLVLGTDVAEMLVDVWTMRAFGAGVRSWPEWVDAQVRRPRVPARVDLAGLADQWLSRAGRRRVHVVLDDSAHALRLAGSRRPAPAELRPSADAVELGRQVAPVVGSLVPPERRTTLMWQRLLPHLAAFPGDPLVVPERHHRRLTRLTSELRQRLAQGDYAVHGALPDPADRHGTTEPDDEGVLAQAIAVLLGPPVGATIPPGAAPAGTGAGEET
jgi:hypothetical protein